MALSASTVFDVRPTVGSDNNGGCFVTGSSGTDFSQQTSPQFALSGVTSAGAGATLLSTAAAASMVGNGANAISGTNITPGLYLVVSVVVGVSISFDRSFATGVAASAVINIGGSLATVAFAVANWVAFNTIYTQGTAGTYVATAAAKITLQATGSPGVPSAIIGYSVTHGDGGQFTWTTATNSVLLVDLSSSSGTAINVLFQNISMTTTAGTKAPAIGSSGTSTNPCGVTLVNCLINGFTVGVAGTSATTYILGLEMFNCRVTGCSSHGVSNGAATYMLGVELDSNGGDAFNSSSAPFPNTVQLWHFCRVIAYNNGANGLNFPFNNTPSGNTTYNLISINHCDLSTNVGAGVLFQDNVCPFARIDNSIFDANGTYGIDAGVANTITKASLGYSNAFFNNTLAPTRGIGSGLGTVTLTSSPYVAIGTNFALNSTAGGGVACKGAGFPGVLTNGGGTGFADIGALQTQGSSSTTTTVVVAPTQVNYFQNERG